MDLEVAKAYRTLQRAGINIAPLSPQLDLADLELNYGKLILAWLEHQNVFCRILDMPKAPASSVRHHYTSTTINEVRRKVSEALYKEKFPDSTGRLILTDGVYITRQNERRWQYAADEIYYCAAGLGVQTLHDIMKIIGRIKSQNTIHCVTMHPSFPGANDVIYLLHSIRTETTAEVNKREKTAQTKALKLQEKKQKKAEKEEADEKALLKELAAKYGLGGLNGKGKVL